MKKVTDLNCDLGENESPSTTKALLRQVTSANIACGGHAGDLSSMRFCLRLAKKMGVKAGAHPGLRDRSNFGRQDQVLNPGEFQLLICSQISCLKTLADQEKVRLHHVKLHGALYQMVEKDPKLGKAYLDCIEEFWPQLAIRSLAGGKITTLAQKRGLRTSPELFADRAYLDPLALLPRTIPGAVLSNPSAVLARMKTYLETGAWPLVDGTSFYPRAQTLCLHGDTPGASLLLQKLKKLFR